MSYNPIIAGGGGSGITEIPKIVLELHLKHAALFRGASWWRRALLNIWIRLEAARIYRQRLHSV